MPLHITGPQAGELSSAIESVTSPDVLTRVLKFKLNDSIHRYDRGKGFDDTRFKLIEDYNAKYHIDKLVVALLEFAPENEDILQFAWKHQVLKRPSGTGGNRNTSDNSLERMLDPVRGFKNPVEFFRRYGKILKSVCRISVPSDVGVEYGTGLLIGDRSVLTNYHVVKSVIEKENGSTPSTIRVLFDFFTDPENNIVSNGVPFMLSNEDDWLVDYSPYHEEDLKVRSLEDGAKLPRPEEMLDYAILRLAGNPGKAQVGGEALEGGAIRGCVPIPVDAEDRFATDFEIGKAAVFVFQHPKGRPVQLDWEKPAILGVNKNLTRAMYDVNTEKGSSGSPCFNSRLELIALHHAGGKDWPSDEKYLYNQGIPIMKIQRLLERRGKIAEIL